MKKLTVGCVSVAALAFAGATQAATISMRFDGITGQSTSYYYSGGARAGDFSGSTTAGKFAWTVITGGTYGSHTFNAGSHFYTFCTELTQFISPGSTYTYDMVSPASMPIPGGGFTIGSFRADLLQELYSNHFQDAVTGSTTLAAAFQMAVWELVYQDADVAEASFDSIGEITLDALDGIFHMTNVAAGTQANTWLGELTGLTSLTDTLVGFAKDVQQDQVTLVPLPPPVLLAAVGFAGIVLGRRKLRGIVG